MNRKRYGPVKSRNFGCGKSPAHAGKVALDIAFGGGHFRTVDTHTQRWRLFTDWTRDVYGIRDMRDVTREHHVAYGKALALRVASSEIAVAYAQGLICSVNVTMRCLRGDNVVWISPSAAVGSRSTVRTTAPSALDLAVVKAAAKALRKAGHGHAAACLELARFVGLRVRETALLDVVEALEQARTLGYVIVTRGTKGGRQRRADPAIARHVPVTPEMIGVLERAAALAAEQGTRNLIPADMSWVRFNRKIRTYAVCRILDDHGLRRFHDARTAYACDRYEELTGFPAPVVAGRRQAFRDADRTARAIIACELGHGRIGVLRAYAGSSR